jgi:predicted ATPase
MPGGFTMLTRLKVSGFKNLVDVDVRFGPFTCIAGANGVGKSNLFDAIKFLSTLADRPLMEAALSVRDEGGRTADVKSLFHRIGADTDKEMAFEAEMIIPQEGIDDLGQKATASITFLTYILTLAYRTDEDGLRSLGSLEILREELTHINIGDANEHLLFAHKPAWRKSAIQGRRTSAFISTEDNKAGQIVIKRHQEGSSGRPLELLAANLPRTVLSVANATESPTTLLARREMQSWRLLQLEPSAMRRPDEFSAPARLGVNGDHLASALYQLARFRNGSKLSEQSIEEAEVQVYAQVANRLSDLINNVHDVRIDRDERRELLTLYVTDHEGTSHPARALSDGTLRFLALAVLLLEPESHGLLCLEEPENGIHPERIPAMLRLLQDIATDVNEPVGPDNPLRQVIINTHSPAVVRQVPEDSLLVAELREQLRGNTRFKGVSFNGLPNSWHEGSKNVSHPVSMAELLAYLGQLTPENERPTFGSVRPAPIFKRRVVDREDIQQLMLPLNGS